MAFRKGIQEIQTQVEHKIKLELPAEGGLLNTRVYSRF